MNMFLIRSVVNRRVSRAMRSRQCGAVLAEAAIILPFLAMLFLTLSDLIFVSNAYTALNQMVREGVMTGSQLSEFSTGMRSNLSTSASGGSRNCPNPLSYVCTLGSDNCGHDAVQCRLQQLRESHRLMFIDVQNSDIQTTYEEASKMLTVVMVARFNGVSPFFRNYRMRLVASGRSRVPNS